MCGKTLKQAIIAIFLLLGLLFCCSLQVSADGGVMNRAEPKQTVMISMTDWNELKTESAAQNLELNQLRQKLIMLKMDSGEQMQQLEKLQKELEEMQISLTNANRSLNDVRNDLSESRTSLEELKNKIKKMEHKQAVIRRQRDIYAGLFVITAGAVFSWM
jgi:hypothetical protein|uniref:Macoilin family n=1 Tax=Podoviridae sp. ct7Ex2 TaxID=2827722 RepID=A0A8S5SCV9_9CAUD|nr:MAG TPA: Macoilin family [Podoviridae sp. ct7Ex2]